MKLTTLSLTLLAASAFSANAASVVFNFNGDTDQPAVAGPLTSAASSNDFGPGVTVSDITVATDSSRVAITDGHDLPSRHSYNSFDEISTTVSFTITVDAFTIVNLSSLEFLYGVYDDLNGTQSGDASFALNTTAGTLGGDSTGTLTMNSGVLVSDDYTATLGGDLNSLTNGSATFTWSFTTANGYGSNNANRGHVMDDITLTGTSSPIPEPSSALLGGLGLLTLVLRRRR